MSARPSPAALAHSLPFGLFMAMLALRAQMPPTWGLDARWVYGWGVLLVGASLAWGWRHYTELGRSGLPSARELGLSLAVGLLVFVAWIQLDAPWMQLGQPSASFVPLDAQGQRQWPLIAVRLIGAALLVPVMEELFWRGCLMRWVERADFQAQDPRRVSARAVLLSTLLFMLAHTLWLAAIVAGLAYAWLYRHSGKLWCAVIAHALTNAALGLWVIRTGQWGFW
jgi:CAAX prenyl protease-like protein